MLTWLLSSGIAGRLRLAYKSESNSIGIAQSRQEERTGHDTDHILHSHHAKYFPIAVRHNQGYARRLRKDGGSSEISSLLASTSEF